MQLDVMGKRVHCLLLYWLELLSSAAAHISPHVHCGQHNATHTIHDTAPLSHKHQPSCHTESSPKESLVITSIFLSEAVPTTVTQTNSYTNSLITRTNDVANDVHSGKIFLFSNISQ